MSVTVRSIQVHHPCHLSLASRNPSVYLPCPYPFLYPYLAHRLFLSNHPIRIFLAHLVMAAHNRVHIESFHNRVHQTDHDSRKALRGKVADEAEVEVQGDGTGVVDVGAGVEAKVQAQVVGVGQWLVGTVGTPREAQEVVVHLSMAAADRVH